MIAHGPAVLGDAVEEDGTAPQVIDVVVGFLVVSLDEQCTVAEVFEAGLDRQLDSGSSRALPLIPSLIGS